MTSTDRHRGRTVVVTGAGSGIGLATARRLHAAGARVIALDLTDGDDRGPFDVTDAGAWQALRADLAADEIHGLACCAGITRRARIGDVTSADMLAAYEVNVIGALLGIQTLAPLMPDGSSIVTVGSLAATTAHYPTAYTASKWALRGLTHNAALELGPNGIRVNIVHPGFIETPMTSSAPEVFRTASIGEASLGRSGHPDEVAAVIDFLLSDAAAYVHGSEIAVDGGASSHGGVKSISDALRVPTITGATR